MKLEIHGLDDLESKLKEGADLKLVKDMLKMHGSQLEQSAMRRAPVDTGFLKRSIGMTVEDSGFTVRIGSTAEYAPYVNFGTRFQTSQPFLTNSFYEQRNKLMGDLRKIMK